MGLSRDFWDGRRVLITGHTGFKGAWLALWLQRLGAHVTGLALPPEDERSTFPALAPWPDLVSVTGDLRDATAVACAVGDADPHVILHLGAQALVRRSYRDPARTWAVNVLGTANVLEAARRAATTQAVVVVTSDKVYANLGAGRPFREDDRLGGRDPYSSSKTGAELVVDTWRRSFFDGSPTSLATARAGNVIGGGDRGEERLLPDLWRALEVGVPVRLRYPQATRPWQFVLEPLAGYLLLAEWLVVDPDATPPAVNFGPEAAGAVPVAELVAQAVSAWGGGSWEVEPGEHPHEAGTLSLDATLARTALGWRPRLDVAAALDWTVEWWRTAARRGDLRRLATDQIEAYEKLMEQ